MKKASISILKAHLSRYLDAVKDGDDVVVTDRGRPVARITAMDADGSKAGRVGQLVREGRMTPPKRPEPAAPEPGPPDPSGRSLDFLLDERANGR